MLQAHTKLGVLIIISYKRLISKIRFFSWLKAIRKCFSFLRVSDKLLGLPRFHSGQLAGISPTDHVVPIVQHRGYPNK